MTGEQMPGPGGIIDAHHHLWVRSRHPQPWIDPVTMAAIDADFTPADLAPLARAAGVTGTVVVQSIASAAETVDLLGVAAEDSVVLGVVGWVDLTARDVTDRIDRLRAAPGGDRLVGIRHLVQGEADPAYLDRPDVRRGIVAVGAAGLVFDLLVRQHQLAMASRLTRELPEVRFVLDHLGKPALGRPELADWTRDLRRLAASPNTTAKLSGLVTEVQRSPWTPDDLRPAVDQALDVFGPDRLMFGSDWPVCLLATSYLRWVEVLAELLGGPERADRAPIWGQTARRVYRLGAS
ncbi:L-fuconolactonase [Micromonospora phaseoli]|uniref:L-fuconolactonase n=1 Tax=Micromonospora phaseoli TaxID=1144548 RepID=A0A1H6Z1J1_9ACTN|nr:amidohydrolase family protein [Micromonospora phaseoli]PZW00479.1 L-fuconolactonase [Micromonospora phaseoli]GIJ80962.1 amidohydrolase [Micromonospora phaseoli]SEJ45864.1 L-fuconolactonase [Micromonospora phaseoli]